MHSGLVILEASRSPGCEEAQFELVTEWRDLCDVPAGQSSMQGGVISDTTRSGTPVNPQNTEK